MSKLETARRIREINHSMNSNMRSYILAVIFGDKNVCCQECKSTNKPLEFHHKRYGLDVTVADLEYLCRECHSGRDDSCVRLDYQMS